MPALTCVTCVTCVRCGGGVGVAQTMLKWQKRRNIAINGKLDAPGAYYVVFAICGIAAMFSAFTLILTKSAFGVLLLSFGGDNQFTEWITYLLLLAFIVFTITTEYWKQRVSRKPEGVRRAPRRAPCAAQGGTGRQLQCKAEGGTRAVGSLAHAHVLGVVVLGGGAGFEVVSGAVCGAFAEDVAADRVGAGRRRVLRGAANHDAARRMPVRRRHRHHLRRHIPAVHRRVKRKLEGKHFAAGRACAMPLLCLLLCLCLLRWLWDGMRWDRMACGDV
jgi:hypothetical protein